MHPDERIRRLHWRAHHRGTREADLLIGGFFDAHHRSWTTGQLDLFAEMLAEQDVDIMAWAHGALQPPARFEGTMMTALKKLDYIKVAR